MKGVRISGRGQNQLSPLSSLINLKLAVLFAQPWSCTIEGGDGLGAGGAGLEPEKLNQLFRPLTILLWEAMLVLVPPHFPSSSSESMISGSMSKRSESFAPSPSIYVILSGVKFGSGTKRGIGPLLLRRWGGGRSASSGVCGREALEWDKEGDSGGGELGGDIFQSVLSKGMANIGGLESGDEVGPVILPHRSPSPVWRTGLRGSGLRRSRSPRWRGRRRGKSR
jgi:hypothetical protein